MTPFIPGQFGQCARYGRFITHFLPVCPTQGRGWRRGREGERKEQEERGGRGRGGIDEAEKAYGRLETRE